MVFTFKNQYLQGVYDKTAKCYANEPEFLQAVGEVLQALEPVVAKDPSLTIAELTRFCNNSPMLSTYKRPRWYCIVEELPHTATGKKMHYVMKQQAAEDLKNGVLKRR